LSFRHSVVDILKIPIICVKKTFAFYWLLP